MNPKSAVYFLPYMNEIIFFSHILLVVGFVLGALRLGKQALVALIALQAVFANLFVIKQMGLFGFSVTCSDVFAIGAILGLNLLQEYYGRQEASNAIRISFLSLLFFSAMSQIHLWYIPIPTDSVHSSFVAILAPAPRIALASLGVYYIVQKIDIRLFGWLKQFFGGKSLGVRIGLSLIVTQLIDTVLFSFFGLYGLVDSLFDIIIISFIVKCLIISCSSPLSMLSKRFVKHVPV